MKKFLAFLLVAVITCVTVEEVTLEKNIFRRFGDWIKKQYEKVKAWLKEHQYWDIIVNTLRDAGKQAAKEVCGRVMDGDTCDKLIDKMTS